MTTGAKIGILVAIALIGGGTGYYFITKDEKEGRGVEPEKPKDDVNPTSEPKQKPDNSEPKSTPQPTKPAATTQTPTQSYAIKSSALPLKRGSKGRLVLLVQRALNRLGAKIKETEVLDAATESAFVNFFLKEIVGESGFYFTFSISKEQYAKLMNQFGGSTKLFNESMKDAAFKAKWEKYTN